MTDVQVSVVLAEDFIRKMTDDEAQDIGLMMRDAARSKLGLERVTGRGMPGAMVTAQ